MPGAGAAWSQSERRFPAPAAAGRGGYRGVGARRCAEARRPGRPAGHDRGRAGAGLPVHQPSRHQRPVRRHQPGAGPGRLRRHRPARPAKPGRRGGPPAHRAARTAAGGTLSRMATDSGPGGPNDAAAALAERLFRDMVGALELYTVYLGERLGLYRALDSGGPATSSELAERTGTAERYIREWLEHHAASGLLEVDDPSAGPASRRYRLPPGHAPVLANPDDVRYRALNGVEIARAGRFLPQLVEAFRTGTAPPPLPWPPEGRPDYNRAVYLNLLGTRWLPGIPDVDLRLRR